MNQGVLLDDPEEVLSTEFLETPEEAASDASDMDSEDSFDQDESDFGAGGNVEPDDGDDEDEQEAAAAKRRRKRRGKRGATEEELANIPPEVLARRKAKAFQAKMIIYGGLGALTLALLLVVLLRAPAYFPESFPKGLPPWNLIFPEWYKPPMRVMEVPGVGQFYPDVLGPKMKQAKAGIEKGLAAIRAASPIFNDESVPLEERLPKAWEKAEEARVHAEQVRKFLDVDGIFVFDATIDQQLRMLEVRIVKDTSSWKALADENGITLETVDPLPEFEGDIRPPTEEPQE